MLQKEHKCGILFMEQLCSFEFIGGYKRKGDVSVTWYLILFLIAYSCFLVDLEDVIHA